MGSECSTARSERAECRLPAAMTRAMSRSATVEPLTVTDADINSLTGLPADTETITDSSCNLAERSATSMAWRIASSAACRSTTAPPLMPRADV